MRDNEVVASIVAGDPSGLEAAYDGYADSLYKYCLFLLGDPAGAADAVQDTFVVAAARAGGLSDPERLRGWLYAVARNECQRVLRARKAAAAPVVPGALAGGSAAAAAGLGALLADAVPGLNPAEREVIELHLWHGLDAAEIEAVLAVSSRQAQLLMSRARDQLKACLDVLLAVRATPSDCAKLASMLAGWDGALTPALRWWVHGHIEHCETCTARCAAEMSAAGVADVAGLAAAAAESLRLAAGPPEALKAHTLALASGQDPTAVAYRAVLLGRPGTFGPDGFPRPLRGRAAEPRRSAVRRRRGTSRQLRTAAAAGVAFAVGIAIVAVAITGHSTPLKLAGGTPPIVAPLVVSAPATSGAPTAVPSSHRPTATRTPRRHAAASPSPTLSPGPVSTTPTGGPPSASPTPSPTTARPTPTPSRTPPAATLIVNPPGGNLQMSPFGVSITLTAQGGSVNWSVTVSSGSGRVLVWPSSGTLQAGRSVTVQVVASRHAAGRQVTVSPGGTVFTIVTGPGGGFVTTGVASFRLAGCPSLTSSPAVWRWWPTIPAGRATSPGSPAGSTMRSGRWRCGCTTWDPRPCPGWPPKTASMSRSTSGSSMRN